jgi:hypothetical protein
MPLEIAKHSDGIVVVCRCYGNLTRADVLDSVKFAFATHQIEPGSSRIVTVAEDAELNELDPEALVDIRSQVLELERQDGRDASFRSVLVASTNMQKMIMRLYKAIWDALYMPGIEFCVVESEEEAWKILGADPAGMLPVAE